MITLPVVEPSQTGAARRRAVQEARRVGLRDADVDRVALITTEIATNLVRHARHGELILVPGDLHDEAAMTVVGVDLGPGIVNPEAAFQDGFTTAPTEARGIGGGLGAVRRLSDLFDMHTDPGGTTLVCAVTATGGDAGDWPDVGGLIVPKPPLAAGGDAFCVRDEDGGLLVMLLDVLGHGEAAAVDARAAVETFRGLGRAELVDAYIAVAEALNGRRGAAALIVEMPVGEDSLRAIGLGNVRGEILARDGSRRGIPCAPGIVGAHTRMPRPTEHEWPAGGTLVLSTDGLRGPERSTEPLCLYARAPLTVAATLYKRRTRGSDDSGVLVARRAA